MPVLVDDGDDDGAGGVAMVNYWRRLCWLRTTNIQRPRVANTNCWACCLPWNSRHSHLDLNDGVRGGAHDGRRQRATVVANSWLPNGNCWMQRLLTLATWATVGTCYYQNMWNQRSYAWASQIGICKQQRHYYPAQTADWVERDHGSQTCMHNVYHALWSLYSCRNSSAMPGSIYHSSCSACSCVHPTCEPPHPDRWAWTRHWCLPMLLCSQDLYPTGVPTEIATTGFDRCPVNQILATNGQTTDRRLQGQNFSMLKPNLKNAVRLHWETRGEKTQNLPCILVLMMFWCDDGSALTGHCDPSNSDFTSLAIEFWLNALN